MNAQIVLKLCIHTNLRCNNYKNKPACYIVRLGLWFQLPMCPETGLTVCVGGV